MALQKAIQFSDGVELPEAYIKIIKLTLSYMSPYSANVTINIYKDVNTYTTGRQEVKQMEFTCSGDVFNTFFSEEQLLSMVPLNCAYNWLRTFDIFVGAITV